MDTKSHLEIKGYVIQLVPIKESGALVTVFTHDGLYTFSAHGIAKMNSKNASIVRLFSYGTYELTQSKKTGYYSLVTGKSLVNLENIYANIRSMLFVEMMVELTLRFLEESQVKKFYPYFDAFFNEILNNSNCSINSLILIYLSKIITENGIYPNTSECVVCGKKKNIMSCSFEDGGFICKNCYRPSKHILQPSEYLLLQRYLSLSHPVEELSKKSFPKETTNQLLSDYVHYLEDKFETKLKSYQLIEKI